VCDDNALSLRRPAYHALGADRFIVKHGSFQLVPVTWARGVPDIDPIRSEFEDELPVDNSESQLALFSQPRYVCTGQWTRARENESLLV